MSSYTLIVASWHVDNRKGAKCRNVAFDLWPETTHCTCSFSKSCDWSTYVTMRTLYEYVYVYMYINIYVQSVTTNLDTPSFCSPRSKYFEIFGPPSPNISKICGPLLKYLNPPRLDHFHTRSWPKATRVMTQSGITTRMLIWLAQKATFAVAAASSEVQFLKHWICNVSSVLLRLTLSYVTCS